MDSNSGHHARSTNVLPSDSALQPSAAPQWVPTHRDESSLGVFAATLNSEDTLVTVQHVARLADATLLAGGGGFRADIFAKAFWVQAGRLAGGKAAGVLGVGRALQSYEVGERLVERNRVSPVSQMLFKKKKNQAGPINSRASRPVLHSANIYGGCWYAEH